MTTRVSLHDYQTDPLLPQKDGVNLAHENIAGLLRQQTGSDLIVEFHDFTRLIADEVYARSVLADVDCVVSNVGPHAHFYFWLRERLGLDFRIMRDVRTAIWSSYLHQEHLCASYLRSDDTLMVASNYTWGIYHRIFPHLARLPDAAVLSADGLFSDSPARASLVVPAPRRRLHARIPGQVIRRQEFPRHRRTADPAQQRSGPPSPLSPGRLR